MKKKVIYNLIFIIILLTSIFLIILSTLGIETNKFNKLISEKISNAKNIESQLQLVKFKLDPKELSLFVETKRPKIIYNNLSIPTKSVKVYINFLPLIKMSLEIKKINLKLEELNHLKLIELSKLIKPSNLNSFLNNNISEIKLSSEIDFYLDDSGKLKNYIVKGNVKNLKADLFNDFIISKIDLSFFADKEDILIKNISGFFDNIKVFNGDIKLNLIKGVKLSSNFNTEIILDDKDIKKYETFLRKFIPIGDITLIDGNFVNNLSINLDDTYKLIDYNYDVSGEINKSKLKFLNVIKSEFIKEEFKEIYFSDLQITTSFSPNNLKFSSKGKYSFNNLDFLQIELNTNYKEEEIKIYSNLDYKDSFNLNLINYKKNNESTANISLDLIKKSNLLIINKFLFKEKDNFIRAKDLVFENYNLKTLNEIEIKNTNNNFLIKWDENILIKGSKFDATNLPKFFNRKKEENKLKNINSSVEIDFKTIKVPLSKKIQNFRLIGEINRGKFIKISSKGDFGDDNFLDISMKKDKKTNKRFLEIYSDLTRPLLTEYSFFKGLAGGKLLYTSLIEGNKSNSKLKIENFKVVNAPGVIKLLSLADLRGLADLVEGDGLSFSMLEINMEKNNNFLKLNEILALGPSMSVLMEGYQDEKGVTSLKGTLVPAKTLNKIISKIPVIGNIVIPKEVGEGLFGISFKMKGSKGDIKTTINPIRTLTPRFIQKIIDRNKNSK